MSSSGGLRGATALVSAAERAIKHLQKAPRIQLGDTRDNPGAYTTGAQVRAKDNKAGKSHKELENAAKPPIGWVWGDWWTPWQRKFPDEPLFNKDAHLRREYPPLSLLELQRLIDLGWIDTSKLIDLTALCNTFQYMCDPVMRQFGIHLTEEGCDIFAACINVEVGWVSSELVLAAIERNGGTITTAYYDPVSLEAVVNPPAFFDKALPIPRRLFPPSDIIGYYTDPKWRGYLADPVKVNEARIELSQKYGYTLPFVDKLLHPGLNEKKDPLQVFLGLAPGQVVNVQDDVVLEPTETDLNLYYNHKI